MKLSGLCVFALAALVAPAAGLLRVPPTRATLSRNVGRPGPTRKQICELVAAGAVASVPCTAFASGGATAGRTTSIPTAKKRYYGRVTADVKQFLAMGAAIRSGSVDDPRVADFFAEGADDLKSAGYLLAVAFKIDGRIPPDKIQQKRNHDALMKSLDQLRATIRGGNAKGAADAYAAALASMETYLAGVELPATSDAAFQ